MKKVLFCLTLISIALFSCKKDKHTQTDPQGKLYPVTFNVTSFTQQNGPVNQDNKAKVTAVVTPTQSNILKLVYKLYDSNNALIKTQVIRKGEPTFGTLKDNLAAGSYSAVFVGVVDTLHFSNSVSPIFTYYFPANNTYSFQETFYKKISFIVSNQDVQQSVVLQRLNSELQIVAKDGIPLDPSFGPTIIKITISSCQIFYSYFDDQSTGTLDYKQVVLNVVGGPATNVPLKPITNLLNTNTPVTVKIVVQANNSASGAILAQKTINNVSLLRNTRTVLTGNLFSDTGPNAFTVTYNTAFSNEINQGF